MMNEQLQHLFQRYFDGQASEADRKELFRLLSAVPDSDLERMMREQWLSFLAPDEGITAEKGREMLQTILAAEPEEPAITPARQIPFMRKWGWAAASVLILLAAGAYFRQASLKKNTGPVVAAPKNIDVAPGKDGAILTLADGTQMVLDSLDNRVIARQNETQVVLQDGQLTYSSSGAQEAQLQATGYAQPSYNTMTTPKGRQFRLTLPDGTNVWLNAASSIRYPTAFTGKERSVEISGEVYFEVARDKAAPFFVRTNHQQVEVLGTGFNINAYADEGSEKTTLVNGQVRVSTGAPLTTQGPSADARNSQLLSPGQQAAVLFSPTRSSSIQVKTVDIDQVTAWKNGIFNFNDKPLEEVMRQLARWYDVDIVYEGNIPKKVFWGGMGRNLNLSQCLSILEKMQVHFRIEEGRKLVVTP